MSKKIPNKIRESRDKPETGSFVVPKAFNQACNAKATLTLYRFVYRSRISFAVVFALFVSFVIQGIDRAEANSEIDTLIDNEISEDLPHLDESEESPAVLEVTEPLDSDTTASTESVSENDSEIPDGSQGELVDLVTEDITDPSIDEVLDPPIDDSGGVATNENLDESEIDEEIQTVEEDIIVNPEVASSSEVMGDTVVVVESDSAFSFNKDECTVLASGSFYCAKNGDKGLKDDLFAAPDIDGDLEIFFTKDGVESQVTSNVVDDAAPFYDKNSNTIVWHRLINDRYQIVSYDVDSGEETIITNTKENNMEPNRQGKYTVWQRWSNGGWNIILFDGEAEKQLTKTTSHNVAPYIHGTLVVWNQHDQVNERTIEMYDIVSETFVTIDDPEGMSVSNPRMVFVYDSLHPNGDIVTKGYDVFAKKFIDLDTLPRSLPEELPESDSTGETRALIQNKPSGKSEVEEIVEDELVVSTSTSNTVVAEGEATSTPTLIPTSDLHEELTLDLSGEISPIMEEVNDSSIIEDLVITSPTVVEISQEIVDFVEPE